MSLARTPLALAWVLAALLCAAFAFTQSPTQSCKRCTGTGRTACEEHERELCAQEDQIEYCSVIADCGACAGVGWLACKDCGGVQAIDAIETKKRVVAARKSAHKVDIDDRFGRPLRKVESRHFVLVVELDRLKVAMPDAKGRMMKRELGNHELLHVYLQRLEELYADYCARLAIDDKQFVQKMRVFVWYLADEHKKGSSLFCGQTAGGGVKLMGTDPTYSVCGNKQNFQDDEKLYRNIAHCVTHLMLSAQKPVAWIGNQKAGWLDEGLACWFEDRLYGICDNYCYQEANTQVSFRSGKYRIGVRKLIEEEKVPPIGEVLEQNSDSLTPPMQAVAFSYVDYLITRDGAKFNELCKQIKAKKPSREALKEVFGLAPLEFESLWRAWVVGTYPKQ